jgi:beta-glucosidase
MRAVTHINGGGLMKSSARKLISTVSILLVLAATIVGCSKEITYPVEPQELGSRGMKWEETDTPDGWTMVTNEDGVTLGYSKSSGLQLIQVDGYAFKDLNRNNLLDQFEDWRVDSDLRAASIVGEIPTEQMMGMKMNPFGIGSVNADSLDDTIRNRLDIGYRQLRAPGSSASGTVKASWNNMVQEYIETLDSIVCIPAVWIADPRSGDVSEWPSNLAMAATFDPAVGAEYGRLMSEEWRAEGVSMQVATQMDLATEPRWSRIPGTFGEDPALSMDMARAIINAWQSTYDEEGNDLGWGEDSVNNQMKHFPGDGAAEGGRESHSLDGAYNVFPGGQFWTHVLPFAACMDLPGLTETITGAMTNFSISVDADGSPIGERVATSFSVYKLNTVLRGMYGWDGYILSDFGTVAAGHIYGVEDLTVVERILLTLQAGVDGIGLFGIRGQEDVDTAMEAYELGVGTLGEEAMNEIMGHSAERMLRTHFNIGIVDNPYLSIERAETVPNSAEHNAAGYQAILKSIVMLKNSGGIIEQASAGAAKPTVYIPWKYSPPVVGRRGTTPASADPVFDLELAGEYFTIVTDRLADRLSGPADDDGNATISPNDIVRASAAEVAAADFALVRIVSPQDGNPKLGGNSYAAPEQIATYVYRPISLQYRPYTADSVYVRLESIGGHMIEAIDESPYGDQSTLVKENRSYYGETGSITNESDLDLVLYTASVADKVILAVDASNPFVFSEFESQVDAIVVGFDGGRSSALPDKAFLDIISGQVEPSALLPIQMPANMDTVEAQFEDVPRDMECHVDSEGNTYDFAFGLDWSGVISDERTAKYDVPPIVGGPPESN